MQSGRRYGKNYQRMAEIAHNRSVQVASLGALANEVTALYGLQQNRLGCVQAGLPRGGSSAGQPSG